MNELTKTRILFFSLFWISGVIAGGLLALSILRVCPQLYKSPYEQRDVTVSVGDHVLYHGKKYGVDIYQDQGFKRIDIIGGLFYQKVIDSYTAGVVTVTFNDDGY